VALWCSQHRLPLGGLLSLDTAWKLALAWYHDRLNPDWQRKSLDGAMALFKELGLTGEFWRLG